MAGEQTKTPEEIKAEEAATAAKAAEATNAATEAEKAKEAEKNKLIPHEKFHEERVKRQKAEERLAALEAEKVAAEKKAEEDKGNFKTLYEKEQARSKQLEEELTGHKTKVTEFETKATQRIETQLQTVPVEADRNMIKNILEGKTLAVQEDLLPTLLKKFGVPENVNAGAEGSGGKGANDRQSKEAEAKKEGNVMGMLKNAPRK